MLGTICFMLPWAVTDGKHLSFIDALFMATSSVCVTGLSVITPAVKFSLFGKIIMAVLMEIGGLSFLNYCSLAFLLFWEEK